MRYAACHRMTDVWSCRMMSDFKVIMTNEETMREFSVLFHGPKDSRPAIMISSKCSHRCDAFCRLSQRSSMICLSKHPDSFDANSSIPGWSVESQCGTPCGLSFQVLPTLICLQQNASEDWFDQVAKHRVREQDLPPECG